jgi:hypothetical protein
MIATAIRVEKEWEVIFSEGKNWRIGIYRPKYTSAAEITELEQHTCPEAFLLLSGNLMMLYKNADGVLCEKTLQPMELTTFTEPHAGFSPDGSGVAFVVENAQFETFYADIRSGERTRHVKVG